VTSPSSGPLIQIDLPDQPTPSAAAPDQVGWGYLRYYGCVTCHDLEDPSTWPRRGPDLDRIGDKTTARWLERWLHDPSSAVPGARMPMVPLTDDERQTLTAFLKEQTGSPGPLVSGDLSQGRELYDELDCARCHPAEGEPRAEKDGPSLGAAGQRIRPGWLTAFLMDPTSVAANSRMHTYGLSGQQAADLAAYVLREGEVEEGKAPGTSKGGLALFVARGCAGCHRINTYRKPLSPPRSDDADNFVDHHRQPGQASDLSLIIPDSRLQIMARVLTADRPAGKVTVDAFLEVHWATPIPLQGVAPSFVDSLATGVQADACGVCHTRQAADWRTSLHFKSMGPGVLGQLDANADDAGFVEGCQACHAPATEQLPMLSDYETNYRYQETFREEGLTCAVCHLRSHTRFGPPPGPDPPASTWAGPGHGGGVAATAFEDSRFCSRCHQFDDDGFRLNGKLLQDTYGEWLASPQAQAGQTCQSCHMPGRRHTWKGIHDPDTVQQAIELGHSQVAAGGDSTAVEIRIANVGAGHHLPTYVTPKLFVKVEWLGSDESGDEVWDVVRVIGREVVLSGSESREVFDTRIPAGGEWVWRTATAGKVTGLRLAVDVHPDHFYLGFFEAYDRDHLDGVTASMIETAEGHVRSSPYRLVEHEITLEN